MKQLVTFGQMSVEKLVRFVCFKIGGERFKHLDCLLLTKVVT